MPGFTTIELKAIPPPIDLPSKPILSLSTNVNSEFFKAKAALITSSV